MTFEKGSLILIDYTAKLKDNGEVFDTTLEEAAKKHSIHEPNVRYRPQLVSIGEPNFPVLKGLDEALAGAGAGSELTIDVEPGKAYGERDTGKIRMVPLRKLGEDAEKVTVGDTINIGGRPGIIRFIGSGRVQIDYNHRYAGKTLSYDVNIRESLDSDEKKIRAILESNIPLDESHVKFEMAGGIVTVSVPDELFRFDGIQGMKHMIQMSIFKYSPSTTHVNFVETYKKPELKPKQEKPVEA